MICSSFSSTSRHGLQLWCYSCCRRRWHVVWTRRAALPPPPQGQGSLRTARAAVAPQGSSPAGHTQTSYRRSLSWHHNTVCHLVSYQASAEDRLLLSLDTEHTGQLLWDDRCRYTGICISRINDNRATVAWLAQNYVTWEENSVSLRLVKAVVLHRLLGWHVGAVGANWVDNRLCTRSVR